MLNQRRLNQIVLALWVGLLVLPATPVSAQSSLPPCPEDQNRWDMCSGIHTNSSGHRYVGEFRNDQRSGYGSLSIPDGRHYVGEFREGKFHGQGTYTFPNGERYIGEFWDDKLNGQGSLFSPDGRLLQNGIWRDSEFVQANNLPAPASAPSGSPPRGQTQGISDTITDQRACRDRFGLFGAAAGAKFARNYEQSFQLYNILKNCGDDVGYIGIGEHYEVGLWVNQDFRLALENYTHAARNGHPLAVFYLARMYADGKGVLQDFVAAHTLANLASIYGGGNTPGEASRLLRYVTERMNAEQIREAQRRAELCKNEYDRYFRYRNCRF